MQFKSFAFIFLTPGFNPETNNAVMEKGGYRFKAIGIDLANKETVIDVAKKCVADGYQMLELCGGFRPEWIHKVGQVINRVC